MLDQTPATAVTSVLAELQAALDSDDAAAAAALFAADGMWRDLLAFTWNIRTLEGPAAIEAMLRAVLRDVRPQDMRPTPGEPMTEGDFNGDPYLQGWFDFQTATGHGHGHVRVRDGRILTLLTTLTDLKGHEEPRARRRPMGVAHAVDPARRTWGQARAAETAALGHGVQPEVVIIGGGQAGLALGARLRQLDVPTIIVERNPRAGDSWRNRYKSLCLHDPVWYDHMPYIPFPDTWPVFTPKDKLGDWLEMYARVMELNFWGSTIARSANHDEASGTWTVVVERDGREITLSPRQLVLATGMSGKPHWPVFPGQDVFRGEQQHSSTHPGPDAYVGKRVVVIGSNNSAHDICAALWEAGVSDVTMVQRTSTHICRSEPLMKYGLGPLYSEDALEAGITTEKADLLSASVPYGMLAPLHRPVYDRIRAEDAAFYAGLEAAGFMLDFGDDDTGLSLKYLRRGSGYYIDVGASQLIIDGRIKLRSRVGVSHLTQTAVVLSDGSELPADLVVYATGYGSMNGFAADLISHEVADKVGKCWGLGSGTTKDPGPWEGEQRNMWKPTQQPGLWFHGGNLHQSRHFSHTLALQLKARQVGIPTPVYGLQAVHHLS